MSSFPLPPPPRVRCPDTARDVLQREVCLQSFSKNLAGDIRPLHEERETCAKLDCVTLKTEHFLLAKVTANKPCDSAQAQVLDGVLRVSDLAHAFENGDGTQRGYHGGDFIWQGQAGLVAFGTLSGITNAGILRAPVFEPACEKCNQPGIMIGRLCGTIQRAPQQQRLLGCQVFGVYRFQFDPGKEGGQGAIRGTAEGVVICPCPTPSAAGN
jgi:hypothetical protein